MKIALIKDSENKTIGYTIEGETKDEKLIVNSIRNMHFFGMDDSRIVYNGREKNPNEPEYVGKLIFKQKSHTNS